MAIALTCSRLRPASPLLCFVLALHTACGATATPVAPIEVASVPQTAPREHEQDDDVEVTPGPVPVTRADPTIGKPTALVTVVVFGDLEDPFYYSATQRLRALAARLGP